MLSFSPRWESIAEAKPIRTREPMKSTNGINAPHGWEISPVRFTSESDPEKLPMERADEADTWGLYRVVNGFPEWHSDYPTARGAMEGAALQSHGAQAEAMLSDGGLENGFESARLATIGRESEHRAAQWVRSPYPYGRDKLPLVQALRHEGIISHRSRNDFHPRPDLRLGEWLKSPLNTTLGRWIISHSAPTRNRELVGWLGEVSGHRFAAGTLISFTPLIGGGQAVLMTGDTLIAEASLDTITPGRFDRAIVGLAESLLAL